MPHPTLTWSLHWSLPAACRPHREPWLLAQGSMLPVPQAKSSGLSWAPLFLTPGWQVLSILPSEFIWDWELFMPHLDAYSSHLAGLPVPVLSYICSLHSSQGCWEASGRAPPSSCCLLRIKESSCNCQAPPPPTGLLTALANCCLKACALAVPRPRTFAPAFHSPSHD